MSSRTRVKVWHPLLLAVVLLGLMGQVAAPNLSRPLKRAQPTLAEAAARSPLAVPVLDADAQFSATHVRSWTQNGSHYLLLDGGVSFRMGVYGFRAQRAVVRVLTERQVGRTVRRLAIYFDHAQPLPGQGPVTAAGRRLLVTAATAANVNLSTDLMQPTADAPDDALVREATQRFAEHDRALAKPTLPAPQGPLYGPAAQQRRAQRREMIQHGDEAIVEMRLAALQRNLPKPPGSTPGSTPGSSPATTHAAAQPATQPATAPAEPIPNRGRILPAKGIFSFNADRVVFQQGKSENAIMLIGHVRMMYQDYVADRTMVLKAERAVLFAGGKREATGGGQMPASSVRGVYLEDNVMATDGTYTVRAPRVYYDARHNKAILLQAVMYTYDVTQQMTLYLRAAAMRQTSRTSFEAHDATLTTSAFAKPSLALGASKLTLEQRPAAGPGPGSDAGTRINTFTASHMTLRFRGLPIFYWPYIAGNEVVSPLKSVGIGQDSVNGTEVRTRWDLFTLAGYKAPRHASLTGSLDYLGDHGAAVGVNMAYRRDNIFGRLNSYFLPSDHGIDRIGGRHDVTHDGQSRGFIHWQHQQTLENDWHLSLEVAHISDPTFLEEYERGEAYQARPYETAISLRKQQDDWAVTGLLSAQLDDFTPQLTTLQAPGYGVEKMPELGYYRIGTDLWDGRLTWFSENRLSRVRAVFGTETPQSRGFDDFTSQLLFGFPANQTFEEAARARHFPLGWRTRFDTRQEITAPMKAGIFDVTPYAVGRLTAYDQNFDEYNGEDDSMRLWAGAGVRIHTQFHRTFDVDSPLLDIHRLRHIIEPSVELFTMGSTLPQGELPIYDTQVEDIQDGSGVRLGLVNTLQTQRGGPGRWRSVDWITLETDLILRSDNTNDAPIPVFYAYRPEYSIGGDHFYSRLLWHVSDTLGVTGELTYDLHNHETAQWRLGATLQHSTRFGSFLYYEEIASINSQLLSFGFNYQLTPKYYLSVAQRLDFGQTGSRVLDIGLERRLPDWRIRIAASFNEIDDEQSVTVMLLPEFLVKQGVSAAGMTLFSPHAR